VEMRNSLRHNTAIQAQPGRGFSRDSEVEAKKNSSWGEGEEVEQSGSVRGWRVGGRLEGHQSLIIAVIMITRGGESVI